MERQRGERETKWKARNLCQCSAQIICSHLSANSTETNLPGNSSLLCPFCNETIFSPQLARFLIRNSHHAFSQLLVVTVRTEELSDRLKVFNTSITLVSKRMCIQPSSQSKNLSVPIYYGVSVGMK